MRGALPDAAIPAIARPGETPRPTAATAARARRG